MDIKLALRLMNKIFKIPNGYIPCHFKIKHIKELYLKISKVKCVELSFIKGKGIEEIKKSINYSSIPIEIREKLYKKKLFDRLYEFILRSGRIVRLFIIYELDDVHIINDLYNKIYIWLSIIDEISEYECSRLLTIFIILSDFTKKIPSKKYEEICIRNVNSAFTFSCKHNNEIFIYRKEEIFKVFIHESFHSFGLDFSNIDHNDESIITNNFKSLDTNRNYRIYESYCEAWAEIINILVIVSYDEKIQDFNQAILRINKYIFYETLWSIFQCCKVLRQYGFQYKDIFDKKKTYVEKDTHVFSYFILKTIILVNIDKFLTWCKKENPSIINFSKKYETINKYYEFIRENSGNKELIEGLNIVDEWFSNDNVSSDEIILIKTMRMSLFG